MKRLLIILASALLVTGCVKDLEYDFEDVEPRVVVMSCVEPDTTIGLRLTFSRFFLSMDRFRTIDNADVALRVNGQPLPGAAVMTSSGDYTHPYRPQAGDRLELSVQVPGKPAVSASTMVPGAVDITDLRMLEHPSSTADNPVYAIRFTLHDPANEDNYYFIRIRTDGAQDYQYCNFSCGDYLINDGIDLAYILESPDSPDGDGDNVQLLAFPDDNIAGRSHEVELKIATYYRNTQYLLEVTSLSRDRYLYERTTYLYDDDPFESLFSEPVQIHSNISGGIGIFAARNRSILPIPIQP